MAEPLATVHSLKKRSVDLELPSDTQPVLLSTRQAAAALGLSMHSIRRAISRGDLSAAKIGNRFQIAFPDLVAYQEINPGRTRPPSRIPRLMRLPPRDQVVASGIPTPTQRLIGRQRETAAIEALLRAPDGPRLLVLTGPGGVGKSRLAIEVALASRDAFAEGAAFVPLASISDPALVASTTAQAIRVRETRDRSLEEQIVWRLGRGHYLLLLDNFEHVVAAAPFVGQLLTSCPLLKILVTSRERLRLSGEHHFPIAPLALPGEGGLDAGRDARETPRDQLPRAAPPIASDVPADIAESAAVQLFVARAAAIAPGFALTPENAAAVANICRRVDGLPLALELAAARIAVLSPEAFLGRFDRRLPLLTGGPRDLPARLRTMRDAIRWSYDLLPAEEQALFRHLSVFAGGFTLEAAEYLSAGRAGDRKKRPNVVLDLIGSLVSKSLVRRTDEQSATPRFELLETIREFALERLQAHGESAAVERQHAAYFLSYAEAAAVSLRGKAQGAHLTSLEIEHDNLRAALSWSLNTPGETPTALRLAAALHWFWFLRDHYREGRGWLEEVLSRPESAERSPARVTALAAAGLLAIRGFRDFPTARAWLQQSITLARALGDKAGHAYALHILVWMDLYQADPSDLRALSEESVALFREAGDRWGLATSLCTLGMAIIVTQDPNAATRVIAESLSISRELGNTWGLARALHYAGEVARFRGDDSQARNLYEESLTLYRELNHHGAVALTLHNLGYVAHHQGSPRRALMYFAEALGEHIAYGDQQNIGYCLAGIAGMAANLEQTEAAARLFGAVDTIFEQLGATIWPIDKRECDRNLEGVRMRLGNDSFIAAFAMGRTLTLEDAIAESMTIVDTVRREADPPAMMPAPHTSAVPGTSGLSPREVEILELVSRHGTNREIAAALSISQRTVEHHISHILTKLGLRKRREAAAWALHHRNLQSLTPSH